MSDIEILCGLSLQTKWTTPEDEVHGPGTKQTDGTGYGCLNVIGFTINMIHFTVYMIDFVNLEL